MTVIYPQTPRQYNESLDEIREQIRNNGFVAVDELASAEPWSDDVPFYCRQSESETRRERLIRKIRKAKQIIEDERMERLYLSLVA